MPHPPPSSASLLDPHSLQRIARIELVARQVMDGYVQGMHRSPHVGFALDFAQHRQYAPGDDIKRLDWRAYAKSERYYIKQYEVSTNLRAHIVLDASASMAYRGAADPLSKFRYAQFIAACLGYLVLRQRDSAGLAVFDHAIRQFLPARAAPSQLMRILHAVESAKPQEESGIAPILHELADRITRRGMVIIISDLIDDPAALTEALHHLRHQRHEVLLMQVMASDELEFPFRKWSLFENLENPGQKLRLDPTLARQRYLQNLAEHLKAIRDAASRLHLSHVLLNTSKPFDEALTTYLARRAEKR
jgi:uncharacterized protein (DUF58 family)